MSRITPDEVLHIADLACLVLSADELDGMARDLDQILDYVETLQEPTAYNGHQGANHVCQVLPCPRGEAGREDAHSFHSTFYGVEASQLV